MTDWPDLDDANRSALRALIGRSEDPIRVLVSFFRSNADIHPHVRESLADVLEGTSCFGARLELKGHKRQNDLERGLISRQRKLEIGRWIEDQIKQHGSRTIAIREAAFHFPKGEDTGNKAINYYRRVQQWIESVKLAGTFLGSLPDQELEHFFHIADRDGTKLPQNRSLEDHYERVLLALWEGDAWKHTPLSERAIILKWEGIPEDSPWFNIGLNIE